MSLDTIENCQNGEKSFFIPCSPLKKTMIRHHVRVVSCPPLKVLLGLVVSSHLFITFLENSQWSLILEVFWIVEVVIIS